MELINIIFEKYGGEKILHIFNSYFTLALLLRHLAFSLFIPSADQPAVQFGPEKSSQIFSQRFETETSAEEPNRFQVLQLMLALAQIEIEKEGLSSEGIN